MTTNVRVESGASLRPREALAEVFGFEGFRPDQEEIVEAILARRDAFVVMPTGGGKSLCYQLPARLMPGTCVVVSPLISLMKDQVDAARANGLAAAFLNSTLSGAERGAVRRRLAAGELELLYLSPERLAVDGFLDELKSAPLAFFAIDEAHCISEWGHDFRPDYLFLANLVKEFPGVPVAAFTATATPRVSGDIVNRLGLRDPFLVRASFNRPNLFYQVRAKEDVNHDLLDFLRDRPDDAGIVYRTTRRSVEETAAFLRSHGINALPYHAGLTPDARAQAQEAFNRDEAPVIVATIAFGMGIDKSNVRFVVHGDLPKNMEGYYQETGRAGRDGEPAHCLLFFSRGDIARIRHFIGQVEDETERRNQENLLKGMVTFASAHACRRRRLLAYFGEEYPVDDCGGCDVCSGEVESVDATRDAQIVLSAIWRTGQRFGANHVVEVVRGANTRKIRQFGHHELKTYGVGADRDAPYWRRVIDALLGGGALAQADGRFPTLSIAPKGNAILRDGVPFRMLREKESPRKNRRRAGAGDGEIVDYDEGLFQRLRALRKEIADEADVPPYVIFSDRSLREMAAFLPEDRRAMGGVHGVGAQKLERYGARFLAAIAEYRDDNPGLAGRGRSPGPPPPAGRTGPARGETFDTTWRMLRDGLGIGEIARRRGIREETIAGHIERLIVDGRDIDPARFLSAERADYIRGLFAASGQEIALSPVVEASHGGVTYTEARLVRAMMTRERDKDKDRGLS